MFRDQPTLPNGVKRVFIVVGAGAVGSLATQILKAKTKTFVIATASRPESRAWCTEMGADLVIDHTRDVVAQLTSAKLTDVDLVLSTAGSATNIVWIASLLRPFGHLSVVDMAASINVGPLIPKSVSLHTEMVFSRTLHGSDVGRQGKILEAIAALLVEGHVRPIATTRLEGLTVETMRAAHTLVESRRTIGKVVITR